MVFWSGANEHIGWGVVDYTYEEFYKDETYRIAGFTGKENLASSYRNTW